MYKKQMTVQKIVCIAVLAAAVLLFITTLGMSTDLYEILNSCFEPGQTTITYFDWDTFQNVTLTSTSPLGWEHVAGAALYTEIQDFNKLAVRLALVLIIVSLLSFIAGNNTRRRYYIFNYIATAVIAVAFIAVSAYILANVIGIKHDFLTKVNFDNDEGLPAMTYSLKTYAEMNDYVIYSKSTMWLDFNIVACVLGMIIPVLFVCNTVWKYLLMKSEEKAINEGLAKKSDNALEAV